MMIEISKQEAVGEALCSARQARASGNVGALSAALDELLACWSDHDPALSGGERTSLRWSISLLLIVVMELVEQQAAEPSTRARSDLRATYASAALQGLLAGSSLHVSTWQEARRLPNPDDVAAQAFAIADAMLRQGDQSSPVSASTAGAADDRMSRTRSGRTASVQPIEAGGRGPGHAGNHPTSTQVAS